MGITDNGDDRQLQMTEMGEYHTMGSDRQDNGNNRQWEMTDSWE